MTNAENPFDVLGKIFHEPKRLAIMSALCSANDGMSFRDLKDECDLTDGNLNRHLKVLKESRSIRIKKSFVDDKPRTTVYLTNEGLNRFNEYLEALADVMEQARKALPREAPALAPIAGKRVTT